MGRVWAPLPREAVEGEANTVGMVLSRKDHDPERERDDERLPDTGDFALTRANYYNARSTVMNTISNMLDYVTHI